MPDVRSHRDEGPDADPVVAVRDTYHDVLSLMIESEDYFSTKTRNDHVPGTKIDRIFVVRQEMRVTVRLASAMCWLLARRAVDDGEDDAEELEESIDPFDNSVCCLDTDCHADARLPNRAKDLLERSYLLYVRVVQMQSRLSGRPYAVQ